MANSSLTEAAKIRALSGGLVERKPMRLPSINVHTATMYDKQIDRNLAILRNILK